MRESLKQSSELLPVRFGEIGFRAATHFGFSRRRTKFLLQQERESSIETRAPSFAKILSTSKTARLSASRAWVNVDSTRESARRPRILVAADLHLAASRSRLYSRFLSIDSNVGSTFPADLAAIALASSLTLHLHRLGEDWIPLLAADRAQRPTKSPGGGPLHTIEDPQKTVGRSRLLDQCGITGK